MLSCNGVAASMLSCNGVAASMLSCNGVSPLRQRGSIV